MAGDPVYLVEVPRKSFVVEVPDLVPVPWQRTRGAGGARFTPAKARAYRDCIVRRAQLVVPRGWRLDQRYDVSVWATFPDRRNRDIDNVVKMVLDALQGVAYQNDAQVDGGSFRRIVDPSSRGHLRVAIDRYDLSE